MTAQDDNKKQQKNPQVNYVSSSRGKEGEASNVNSELLAEVSKEINLPKEVKDAGVEHLHGSIELPPDVKKLGVTQSGPSTPVMPAASATVTLPLSDDKIMEGQNAPVTTSIKWLAVWCLRRLKLAHLMLKKIHGKIVRTSVN